MKASYLSYASPDVAEKIVHNPMRTIEDSLLLFGIPARWFLKLYEENDTFSEFFFQLDPRSGRSARFAMDHKNSDCVLNDSAQWISLLRRTSISTQYWLWISSSRQIMSEHRVSSLLITIIDELIGIVTGPRTCAPEPLQRPCLRHPYFQHSFDHGIPLSWTAVTYASEARVENDGRFNVHHFPIIKNGRPIGVVSTGDIIKKRAMGSVLFNKRYFQTKQHRRLTSH